MLRRRAAERGIIRIDGIRSLDRRFKFLNDELQECRTTAGCHRFGRGARTAHHLLQFAARGRRQVSVTFAQCADEPVVNASYAAAELVAGYLGAGLPNRREWWSAMDRHPEGLESPGWA